MKRKITSVMISVAALLSLSAQPILAAPDSTVPAGFDVKGPPVVTVNNPDIDMYYGEGQTLTVHVDLTPTGYTFGDYTFLIVGTYWDGSAADGPSEAEWVSAQGDSRFSSANMAWDAVGGYELFNNPADSTWEYGIMTTPALDSTSGDFTFVFAPGKVAEETDAGSKWQFYAQVVVVTPEGNLVTNAFDSTPADMNLYTEFVSGPTEIQWGTVTPGASYSETMLGLPGVTFISNGYWILGARADSQYWGDPGAEILPSLGYGTPLNNEFGIKLGLDSNLESGNQIGLTTENQVLALGSPTYESGSTFPAIYAFLALGPVFPSGAFNGNVIFAMSPD